MSLLTEVEKGIHGGNIGLLTGLPKVSKVINNLQDAEFHILGAYKKTGKTKFLHFFYLIAPYLKNPALDIEWNYFSLEMPLIKVQAQCISLLALIKHKKRFSDAYILSKGDHKLTNEDKDLVEHIYHEDIEPLFGTYSEDGKMLKKGKVNFITRTNPTGILRYSENYFKERGELVKYTYHTEVNGKLVATEATKFKRTDGKKTITLIDHIGRVGKERGFFTKENIDKTSEYIFNLRNDYGGLWVATSQFNRGVSSIERLKFSGEALTPSAEDFKDSGNMAEDADLVIALFNPAYYRHIHNYMKTDNSPGYDLDVMDGHFRSLHILENRNGDGFLDVGLYFDGAAGFFQELPAPEDINYNNYYLG